MARHIPTDMTFGELRALRESLSLNVDALDVLLSQMESLGFDQITCVNVKDAVKSPNIIQNFVNGANRGLSEAVAERAKASTVKKPTKKKSTKK